MKKNRLIYVLTGIIAFVVMSGTVLLAQPRDHNHGFMLKGPWEILVQKDMKGQALHFPVAVAHDNKPEELNQTLPVLGTPVKIKLLD